MSFEYRETPEKIIIHLNQLDQVVINRVGEEITEIIRIASASQKRLVIDFSGVTFISSSIIGKMAFIHKDCQRRSLDVRAKGVPSSIHAMFDLLHLKFFFREDDDEDGGLGAKVPNPKPPTSPEGHAELPWGKTDYEQDHPDF